ncbi:hypothetical protein SLS54_009855 [Diplodia seriata]
MEDMTEGKNGLTSELDALYSDAVVAKIWKVASKALNKDEPPSSFPEYTEPGGTEYIYSDASFWTSGFFPGCLYLLRERQLKHPTRFPRHHDGRPTIHPTILDFASKWWASAPAQQASRTDTHDLGFMIQPWAALGLTLDGDATCRAAIVTGARSLATRFDARVGAMRSWDGCETRAYKYDDARTDFLVVIDNMMSA